MSLVKKALAVIIAVIFTAGIAISLRGVAYSPRAPIIISTRDEATPDTATFDEIAPTINASTTAPSEMPTEIPTNACETDTNEIEEISYSDGDTEDSEEESLNDIVEDGADRDDDIISEPIGYSENDLDLLARVILAEAGGCSEQCQWLVASTIMNLADELGDGTLESIVYNTNIVYISYSVPDAQCYRVAARVLSGDRDYLVKAFRSDYYHDFGTPYTSVDNVYFSTF